jgi:hypothetical protein
MAQACSQDDTAYFDGFLDTSCLDTLNETTLDTFGGLRLTTNGTPTATAWDTASDFDTGITWDASRLPRLACARSQPTPAAAVANRRSSSFRRLCCRCRPTTPTRC